MTSIADPQIEDRIKSAMINCPLDDELKLIGHH